MPAATNYALEYDVMLKALIIGNAGVGKSSLLLRYAEDSYNTSYLATIGVDFRVRTFEQDGQIVKLQIWDTAGQDRFRSITASYYRGAHCVLLVYDCTDRESFEAIPQWLRELRAAGASESVVVVLVANKTDRTAETGRVVTPEEGRDLAEYNDILYTETSAQSAKGVQEAFAMVVDTALPMRLNEMAEKNRNEKIFLSGQPLERHPTCMQRMAAWLGW